MDVIINTYLTNISFICIFIMIISLIVAVIKKTMITYAIIISNAIILGISLFFENEILGTTYVLLGQNKIIIDIAGLGFRPFYLSAEYFYMNYTIFTSMFVHADPIHLFGNMLVFFFMGIAFEQRIGWKKFLVIYLITGICAALTQSFINLASAPQFASENFKSLIEYQKTQAVANAGAIPLVGASGAIFGILGAFAFSYPRDEVVMPIPLGIMLIMKIKVMYAAILFAVVETVIVFISPLDFTAHYAHLGGLLSGFVLAALLIRKNTHTKKGKTIYYDEKEQQIIKDIDYDSLEKLADTPKLKEILNKIKNENVPQVQKIWLNHFLDKVKCPKCQSGLNYDNSKIWCKKCGFKSKYQK